MGWPSLAETFCPSFARLRDTSFCVMLEDWLAFWPAQFPLETIKKASATKMEVIIKSPLPFERYLSKILRRGAQSK
jgi:hypothetical protein